MATTQEILDAARKVGEMIAQHDSAKKFEAVMRKLQADVEAQRTLNDYNRFLEKLGEKEAAGKPIEVEDKRNLEKLQAGLARSATLRDFQMAQMDYLDLMRRVDEAMSGADQQAPAQSAPGAGGAGAGGSPLIGGAGKKLN